MSESNFFYQQSYLKRCNACGHRLQTTDEKLRRCPKCGKCRLAKTGRMKVVVGNITFGGDLAPLPPLPPLPPL